MTESNEPERQPDCGEMCEHEIDTCSQCGGVIVRIYHVIDRVPDKEFCSPTCLFDFAFRDNEDTQP